MIAEKITPELVVGACARMKAEGYRFVTMTCTAIDINSFEILYHFDKNLELSTLRLTTTKDSPVHSITAVYFAAFLVENEIQDLFGLRFPGLALDYNGTLYLDEEIKTAPLCKYSVKENEKVGE